MDARYPERWLNDRRILRLSDRNFRVFLTALAWSVSNRTDGYLERDDLDLIPGAEDAAASLVRAGLWEAKGAGFLIVDYATTQTSKDQAAVLDTKRRNDRDAQARKRARDKQSPNPPDSQGDSQPDVSVTNQPDYKGKDRPGRQGQEDQPPHPPEDYDEPSQVRSVPAPVTGRDDLQCGWCHGPAGGCDCLGGQESPAYVRRVRAS